MSNLVFGTDPEKFAGYKRNGEYFVLPPAWFRVYGNVPYVPDVKHPQFLNAWNDMGVIVMEDGVAFEYTIKPSSDWKELFDRVNFADKLVSEVVLSGFPNDCEPEILTIPTINYDVKRWNKESAEFRMCLIFGCDQDRDADNNNRLGKTIDALKHPFRYGGGHIHVSGSPKIKEEPILAIQSLKFTAGLAAVAFSDVPELDKARTYLYGKPAKYRVQEYSKLFEGIPHTDGGIEYRTPSNRWTSSFEHAKNLFNWVEIGISNFLEGGLILEMFDKYNEDVRNAIINCNQPLAKDLLSTFEARI